MPDQSTHRCLFRLFNAMTGESVNLVMLDETVVADPTVINQNNMTLQPLKNGGIWTLVPMDEREPQVNALARMQQYLDMLTKQPNPLFSSYINKVDAFISACMQLFGDFEYIDISNPVVELSYLINPVDGTKANWEPNVRKRSVLEGLIDEVMQRSSELKDHHDLGDH